MGDIYLNFGLAEGIPLKNTDHARTVVFHECKHNVFCFDRSGKLPAIFFHAVNEKIGKRVNLDATTEIKNASIEFKL